MRRAHPAVPCCSYEMNPNPNLHYPKQHTEPAKFNQMPATLHTAPAPTYTAPAPAPALAQSAKLKIEDMMAQAGDIDPAMDARAAVSAVAAADFGRPPPTSLWGGGGASFGTSLWGGGGASFGASAWACCASRGSCCWLF